MIIKLELSNFRNFKNQTFFFSTKNLITGKNAKGKTSIVEAIFLCFNGFSFRTRVDKEWVSHGKNFASVKLTLHDETEINIIWNNGKKSVSINNEKATLKKLFERFKYGLFTNNDLIMILGDPEIKRKFLYQIVSQIYPEFIEELRFYRNIVRKRNYVLKTKELSLKRHIDELFVSKAILIENYIERTVKILNENLKGFLNEELKIEIRRSFLPDNTEFNLKILKQIEEKEFMEGKTLTGPHRMKVEFKLNEFNLKTYGSLGQKKFWAFIIKYTWADYLKKRFAQSIPFLIDDLFSEIDSERIDFILKLLKSYKDQIILTSIEHSLREVLSGWNLIEL